MRQFYYQLCITYIKNKYFKSVKEVIQLKFGLIFLISGQKLS